MNGGSTTTGDTDTFTLTDTSNDSFNGNDSGHVGGPAVSTSAWRSPRRRRPEATMATPMETTATKR